MGSLRALGSTSLQILRSSGAWLVLAAACGRADGKDEWRPAPGAGGETAVAGSGGAAAASGAGGTTSPDAGGQAGQGVIEEPEPSGLGSEGATGDALLTSVLAVGAQEILLARCGACHSGTADSGGIGDVTDIADLLVRGTIVPGAADASPLIESVRSGRMPPSANQALTPGEQAVLSDFINGLDLAPLGECRPLDQVSYDDVYAALAADIGAQPEASRPFIRYLGLHYASNARYCGPLLQRQRHALFKAINSVSTGNDVVSPVPIDPSELLYRIDLRDYGWNRPIDLEDDGTVDHTDGWRAIVAAAGPYGVEFAGADADVVKLLAATPVPFLPLNAFVHATQAGDVYYALVGARQNIEQTRLDLGVDLIDGLEAGAVSRAAFSGRRADGQFDALVDRVEQLNHPGRDYWLMSMFTTVRGSSIYDDPFDLYGDSAQSIFNLPNGLQAYAVEANGGQRLAQIPEVCLDQCFRPQRVNAAACHACHAGGILPVEDLMRPYVERYSISFDSETIADVQAMYSTQAEFDALIASARERHQAALERAGVPRGEPDRISSVYFDFELDVGLEQASAELMVPWQVLEDGIRTGEPALLPLLDGAPISRATFGQVFRGVLCSYSLGNNRPLQCQ